MHHRTARVSLIRDLFYYAQSKGIEKEALSAQAGIPLSAFDDPEGKIPFHQINAAWEQASKLTNDPMIGLHLGETYEVSSLGIVGYLLFNSKTLSEAMEKLSRYHDLIGGYMQVKREIENNDMRVVFTLDPRITTRFPFSSRQIIESALVFAGKIVKTLTREPIAPRTVWFAFPSPANKHEYERVLGMNVLFGQEENMLVYEGKYSTLPVVSSNPALLALFEQHADLMMERAQNGGTFSEKLRGLVLEHIQNPKLNIEFAARELAMTPRTLQRKLKQEGTSYQAVFDEVRKKLATTYLRDMNFTAWETALLLGFSESSAFVKSFKRWTGMYPKEFKDRSR